MKNLLALFKLRCRLQTSERIGNAVSVFLFTMSVSLMTVFFLTRIYAPDFIISQVGQRDMTVYRKNNADVNDNIISDIETLEQAGYKVDLEWFLPIENLAQNETGIFILRLVDEPSLVDEILLSMQAAHKLKAKAGDLVFVDVIGREMQVSGVEPPVTNLSEAILYGYITLDLRHAPAISSYFGIPDILADMYKGIGITASDMDMNTEILSDFTQSALYNGYLVITQADESIIVRETLEMTENMLHFLATFCMVITMLGILGLLHLKEAKLTEKNTILRVYGMTPQHAYLFAFFDAAINTFISGVIGTIGGFVLFIITANILMGIDITIISALLAYGIVVFIKNALLCFSLLFSCNVWLYNRIFHMDIMSVFQKRPGLLKKYKRAEWIAGGWLAFAGLSSLFMRDLQVITYLFYAIIIVVLLYFIFVVGFWVMRRFKFRINNIFNLSYMLLARRKRFTAMVGTALVVLAAMVIIFYNVFIGVDNFLDNLWIRLNGYNTVVVITPEQEKDFWADLKDKDIPFYVTYVKDMEFSDPDISRIYNLAAIRDEQNIVPHLIPAPGNFFANGYFLALELNIRYAEEQTFNGTITHNFFDESPISLNLTGEVGTLFDNPGSYTVAVNYDDIADKIDDTFRRCILMGLPLDSVEIVEEIAKNYGAYIYTSNEIIKTYRDSLYNFILYIYLTCILLASASVAFLFALCCTVVFSRKRELILYKVIGASGKDTDIILLFENALIALIAAIMILLLNYGLFNLYSGFFVNVVAYSLPMVIVFGILLGSLSIISLITFISSKIIRLESIVSLLRVD